MIRPRGYQVPHPGTPLNWPAHFSFNIAIGTNLNSILIHCSFMMPIFWWLGTRRSCLGHFWILIVGFRLRYVVFSLNFLFPPFFVLLQFFSTQTCLSNAPQVGTNRPLNFDHSPKFDFSPTSQSNTDKWARIDVRMVLFETCPIMSSSHVFTNSEITNPRFFFSQNCLCFDFLITV